MLEVNFDMIYIIYKISISFKVFSNAFSSSITDFQLKRNINNLFFFTSSRLEKDKILEENILKGVRYFFRQKKEIDDTAIKDIRNIFRLKKEIEAIKSRIITGIRYYYNSVRVGSFWSNNSINMKATVIEIKYCQLKNILTNYTILKSHHK